VEMVLTDRAGGSRRLPDVLPAASARSAISGWKLASARRSDIKQAEAVENWRLVRSILSPGYDCLIRSEAGIWFIGRYSQRGDQHGNSRGC